MDCMKSPLNSPTVHEEDIHTPNYSKSQTLLVSLQSQEGDL